MATLRWCRWTIYSKAVLGRVTFASHALLSIWRTVSLLGDRCWLLAVALLGLLLEFIVTMATRRGREWNWFSPSTLFYLSAIVPSLWLQKLRNMGHIASDRAPNASSVIPDFDTSLASVGLTTLEWQQVLEQTMLVVIILGRWLQPKGDISRSALSQILLVYLSLAADIIDFGTIFSEPEVTKSESFSYVLLCAWTWCLLQFTLILTRTTDDAPQNGAESTHVTSAKGGEITRESIPLSEVKHFRETLESRYTSDDVIDTVKEDICRETYQFSCGTEIWSILLTCLVQDGPFLLLRIIAMASFHVFNYTIVFFVCKNSLILSLNVYRLSALCIESHEERRQRLVGNTE